MEYATSTHEQKKLVQSVEKSLSPLLGKQINLLTDDELARELAPVKVALESVNAEKLLRLTRVHSGGAQLSNGISVRPIHAEIHPYAEGIRYIHLNESHGIYSIGVFVFPPGAVIPLHNHPGMTVLSRVLYGSAQVKSFDIIPPEVKKRSNKNNIKSSSQPGLIRRLILGVRKLQPPGVGRTKSSHTMPLHTLNVNENKTMVLKSPQISELWPNTGNVHQFTAGPDGAAVLDVLVPPYDVEDERDCSFYEKSDHSTLPWRKEEGRMKGHLVQMEQPEWFECLAGQYKDFGDQDSDDGEPQHLEMHADY